MLVDTAKTKKTRGALLSGTAPLTFEKWWKRVKIRRRKEAWETWCELHAVGLFEWAWVETTWLTRVARFGENQDRLSKHRYLAPGVVYRHLSDVPDYDPDSNKFVGFWHGEVPTMIPSEKSQRKRKDSTPNEQRTNSESTKNRQVNESVKELTQENGASILIDTDLRSVIPKGNRYRSSDPSGEPTNISELADNGLQTLLDAPTWHVIEDVPMPGQIDYWTDEQIWQHIAAMEKDPVKGLRMWRSRIQRAIVYDPKLKKLRLSLIKMWRAQDLYDDESPLDSPISYLNKGFMRWLKAKERKQLEGQTNEHEENESA
jgi:hypothetical protein